MHELTNALFLSRSELASTEAERRRLKELHSQVKTALQDSYGAQQEQQKQVGWEGSRAWLGMAAGNVRAYEGGLVRLLTMLCVCTRMLRLVCPLCTRASPEQCKELEDLCAAQQNSLEEGEERYRSLQEQQDQLHHAALASKAQLVTAQAQVGRMPSMAMCCLRGAPSSCVAAPQVHPDGGWHGAPTRPCPCLLLLLCSCCCCCCLAHRGTRAA